MFKRGLEVLAKFGSQTDQTLDRTNYLWLIIINNKYNTVVLKFIAVKQTQKFKNMKKNTMAFKWTHTMYKNTGLCC